LDLCNFSFIAKKSAVVLIIQVHAVCELSQSHERN